jgi:4-amino-4-deoxy-L-arabinose transferase-like glycosyltransferase
MAATSDGKHGSAPLLGILLGVLLGLTALRIVLLMASPLDLFVDEAQYWLWSTAPDFGYYSKPPVIAWVIALTTALVGDGEWGVRLASPLLHGGTAGFIFLAGRTLYGPRTGVGAALLYASLPAVSFSSFLISTDVPLLLCWSAALYALIQAERRGGLWWPALGLALGLGLLSKYAMAFFLVGWLGHVLSSGRRPGRGEAVALAVAFAVYAPNLAWNLAHDFVSYRHTSANADLPAARIDPLRMLGFIAGQAALLGPGAFLGLGAALATTSLREKPAGLLVWLSWPPLLFYTGLALVTGANANWAVTAHVAGVILAARWLMTRRWRRLLLVTLLFNALLGALLAAGILLWGGDQARFPLHADPLKRLRGWDDLGRQVSRWRQTAPDACLLTSDRSMAAALAYYARPRPAPVVKWHPPGPIRDHFDLTADLAHTPCTTWLLIVDPARAAPISASFAHAEALGLVQRPQGRGRVAIYGVYRLQEFTGYPTPSTSP